MNLWTSLGRIPLVAALLAGDLCCWLALGTDRSPGPHPTLAGLLTTAAAWILQAALLWATVLVILLLLEPVAGRELTGYAACPPAVRRVLLLACGVIALGAVTGPVHAEEPHTPTPQVHLDGLPLPDRTTDRTKGRIPADGASAGATVHHGDSLWLIARARLRAEQPGRVPSNVEIERAWRSWYAANRERVGADPDLIVPGTALDAPPDPPARTTQNPTRP